LISKSGKRNQDLKTIVGNLTKSRVQIITRKENLKCL